MTVTTSITSQKTFGPYYLQDPGYAWDETAVLNIDIQQGTCYNPIIEIGIYGNDWEGSGEDANLYFNNYYYGKITPGVQDTCYYVSITPDFDLGTYAGLLFCGAWDCCLVHGRVRCGPYTRRGTFF